MKIAFATQDKERVDAHFGWAKYIAIYEINAEGYRYLETHDFGGELAEDGNEDKLAPKLDVIKDCAIVYVAAIGGSRPPAWWPPRSTRSRWPGRNPSSTSSTSCRTCSRAPRRRGCARPSPRARNGLMTLKKRPEK
jgi:hypothetical protein